MSRIVRTPPYIILFVSDRCWNRCRHCWYNERWKANNLAAESMTFDELSRLADSIDRIRFLSLTGGEAFLRDDIVEITELFTRKTRIDRYEIPTSGFDTDLVVSTTERILRTNGHVPFRVDVSLDGTRETHDGIRNTPGGCASALRTVRGLRALQERYAHFDLGIITTLSAFNHHEIDAIGALVEEVHPDGEWMINIVRGDPREPVAAAVDIERYRAGHDLIEDRIRKGRYRGHRGHRYAGWLSAKNAVRRRAIMRILSGECRGGGCAAGALAGVIYTDGSVMPCEMLDRSFGNLREHDYNLAELWNSPAADEIREWIQDSRCVCTHECFLSVSLLIQPRYWPGIVHERVKLFIAGAVGNRS